MKPFQFTALSLLLGMSLPLYGMDIVAETGTHSGGDTLKTAGVANGNVDSIRAGDGLSIMAGSGFEINQKTLFLITAGIKQEVINSENDRISFVRYPLDLMVQFNTRKLIYGIGATYHFNPVYREETTTTKQTIDFKNAMGYQFDVRYVLFEGVYVAGRYTKIEYEVENDPVNTTYDGTSIGVLLGIQL